MFYGAQMNLFPQLSILGGQSNLVGGEYSPFRILHMCIVAENGEQRMVGNGEKESKLEQEVPE